MLGVGWTEMLVIGVIALIVIGPKDLPIMMRRIGQVAGTIRRMGNEFQREINKTAGLDEVRSLRNSITAPLKQTTDEIRREFNALGASGPKPSGAIAPADPKAESVVDEIRAQAGLAPADSAAVSPVTAAITAAVKNAKPPLKAAAVPGSTVQTTDLAPVAQEATVPTPAKAPAGKRAPTKPKPSAGATPKAAAEPVAAAAPKAPAKPKAVPAKRAAAPRKAKAKPTAGDA